MTTQNALGRANMPRAEAEPLSAPGINASSTPAHEDARTQMEPLDGPRWALYLQARIWRFLMAIGMLLHRMARPRPPKPAFSRVIPTTISPKQGAVSILFYTPTSYTQRKSSGGRKFPVVVNFHGGGFTLGCATDDARWASAVTTHVDAVVACVEYRRAPEHPFPTAVEDGVDALIYIAAHAEELHLDPGRVAVSGFSSGGNMALTVPLRLQEELFLDEDLATSKEAAEVTEVTPSKAPLVQIATVESPQENAQRIATMLKALRIVVVCAWYPSTDYTRTREERRATNVRKDQELGSVFTQLFDRSYLQPPSLNMGNPYLSPGVASDALLAALPENIVLYTCEWDMLLDEAKAFKDRLRAVDKHVEYTMVEGVPHGWDKAPNPLRQSPGVDKHYADCCKILRELLCDDDGLGGGPDDSKVGACAMPEGESGSNHISHH